MIKQQIADLVWQHAAEVIAFRRDFHKYPESAWTEYRTSAIIARKLQEWGYEVFLGEDILSLENRPSLPVDEILARAEQRAAEQGTPEDMLLQMSGGKTGVMGILHCGQGPVTALRVDIDGIEVEESTDASHLPTREGFASVNKGICHACGHDAHAAIGLGVAQVLAGCREHLLGTVKLLFQPGEEGMRGAKSMTAKGLLDDVDYFFGAHIGIKAKRTGDIVAGCYDFLATSKLDAIFTGEAAHAGICPEQGKNALMAACTACTQLYAIPRHGSGASRVNVGYLSGGGGRNVVPEKATLKLETRGITSEINAYMDSAARRIIEGAAHMQGVAVEIRDAGSAMGARSDHELIKVVVEAAAEMDSICNIVESDSFGACEDVTYMINRVQERGGQATFLMIGTKMAAGHHSGSFDIDEASLAIGTRLLSLSMATKLQP